MWEKKAEVASPGSPFLRTGKVKEGHVVRGHPCGPRAKLQGLGVAWEAVGVPPSLSSCCLIGQSGRKTGRPPGIGARVSSGPFKGEGAKGLKLEGTSLRLTFNTVFWGGKVCLDLKCFHVFSVCISAGARRNHTLRHDRL